jgi:hypothetical protein
MKTSFLLSILLTSILSAQQPAPPPPPEAGGGGSIPGGNLDLSAIPIPEADRQKVPKLSAAEIKVMPIQISVVPVGYVAPPIIYIDSGGMPREQYRDPLEYPPSSYHFATEHGSIRVIGAHNQIASPTSIPRHAQLAFSYEIPPDGKAAEPTEAGKPRLKSMGTFAVPAGATHLMVVVWKNPSEKLWKNPEFKVIDVSPGLVKSHEAVVINASSRELAIQRGDLPYKIRPGFMGKIALPVNAKGEVPMFVSAASDVGWHRLSGSVLGPDEDERIFVLAWQAQESRAQPSGVSLQAVAKRLPDAKPFEVPREP